MFDHLVEGDGMSDDVILPVVLCDGLPVRANANKLLRPLLREDMILTWTADSAEGKELFWNQMRDKLNSGVTATSQDTPEPSTPRLSSRRGLADEANDLGITTTGNTQV